MLNVVRFLDGGFEALPPNAWRPFGFGLRSCIGRAFAEQEMLMVAALIFQRFQIEAADPTYDLSKMLQELQEST
jgi:cytochrome P450/NADPH-cytochrome P450 reductase